MGLWFLAWVEASASNVLVVVADDLGVDKVSSYAADRPTTGAQYLPETAAIDGLAAAGLRFRRAWAEPMCSPTRATLLTGVHPFRHGVGDALGQRAVGVDPAAFEPLAELYADQGYATGFFGKWHVGSQDATGRWRRPNRFGRTRIQQHPGLMGFRDFWGTFDGAPLDYDRWTAYEYHEGSTGTHTFTSSTVTTHATPETAARALDWISDQTGPWLALVGFHAPHAPTAYGTWAYEDVDPTCYRSPELACLATETCADEPRAVYQAMVECMDLEIEGLLAGISPSVLDETLVVFLGDNGTPPAVQEGAFLSPTRGKATAYENGLLVPFVVADGATWRTGAAGRIASPGLELDAGVEVVDLYETLYEQVAGAPSTAGDGQSFADCFSATEPTCGRGAEEYGYGEMFEVESGAVSLGRAGVRYGHDKMVAEYDTVDDCIETEFYDTEADPFELAPVSAVGTIPDLLRDWFVDLHAGTGSWADGVPFCS